MPEFWFSLWILIIPARSGNFVNPNKGCESIVAFYKSYVTIYLEYINNYDNIKLILWWGIGDFIAFYVGEREEVR